METYCLYLIKNSRMSLTQYNSLEEARKYLKSRRGVQAWAIDCSSGGMVESEYNAIGSVQFWQAADRYRESMSRFTEK